MTRGSDFTFTNLGQITQRRVAYDTDNMPTQVWAQQSGVTTYFSYDGDGDRVKKTTSGGATTYYVGDHYEVKNDEALKYIFAGNLRLIMIKGNSTFYYHKDHLNSTSVMTDNSGTVVETAQYEPFGATRDHTGQDMSGYKFTDQELDNETNLYNYDARLYDPVIGRFITADKIVPDWYDPQNLNTYAYCKNNPLIYIDPNGHEPVKSQVTTLNKFIGQLNKIEGNLNFKDTLNKLGKYPFGGTPASNPLSKYRYIYTKQMGWLDMTHVLGVAFELNKKLESLSSSEFLQTLTKQHYNAYQYARFELWNKTVSIEEGQAKSGVIQSAWSYEDAPSNLVGLEFYFDSSFNKKLSSQLETYLNDLEATDPKNAPNWKNVPKKEVIGRPPTATNKSFDPMYTLDEE